MELRHIVALLVLKYNVVFAPGDDGKEVEKAMKDQFAAVPGSLQLVFLRRTD